MVYPHFAYITYGGYNEKWWTDEVAGESLNDEECTTDALNAFVRNSRPLQLHFFPEPDDHNVPTDAGFVRHLVCVHTQHAIPSFSVHKLCMYLYKNTNYVHVCAKISEV